MARVLVNYTYNKANDEDKILSSDCVFADQKVAVMETEEEIKKPLVVPFTDNSGRTIFVVVDKEKYEMVHKKFYLTADADGNVSESPNGTPVWLPKDTDISQLRFINNVLVKVENKEESKEEKESKEKAKPNSKKRTEA